MELRPGDFALFEEYNKNTNEFKESVKKIRKILVVCEDGRILDVRRIYFVIPEGLKTHRVGFNGYDHDYVMKNSMEDDTK